jgi:hypothetical protein
VAIPLLFQFAIALFTGMVAATFIPPVRRAIPRPVEVSLWVALIVASVLGLLSVTDEDARSLSMSVFWGADRVVNTVVGLLLGGIAGWVMDNRFVVVTWLLIIAGVDVFALILLRAIRTARPWQPRVRLREWMEVPVQAAPARVRAAAADPLADVNRRVAAAGAVAGAALVAKSASASTWIRDVALPREAARLSQAAETGRAESRARLESLRDAAAHLQYAARAWYEAAGEPVLGDLAVKANDAVRTAARKGLRPPALRPGDVVEIQALLGAQSIGWYGPLSAEPAEQPRGEHGADDSEHADRLAS